MFGRRFELFKAFGFPIRIDVSWFFIAVLVTWSLAVAWFPQSHAGLESRTYWLMAAAGALGLFTSIVLHELGHALVARREGMRMRGITLFVFGGVAEMEDEPPSARAEFLVAVAGPIASVASAAVCHGLALGVQSAGGPLPVFGVLRYLAGINFVLVLFNMIPAFPLDGGRVLRSILWHWRGSLRRATRITAAIGSGFGVFLIVMGVVSILGGNLVGGFWWILLGAFLRSAAQMSYQQVLIRRMLEGEPVSHIMEPAPITVPPDTSVASLVEDYIYKYHHKMFPVARNGGLMGCVSTAQVKQVPREQWGTTLVEQIAEPCGRESTIRPDEDALRAFFRVGRDGIARLFVVERGKLLGIVTPRDLMKLISFKLELEEGEPGLAQLSP